jgi:hypothetical protein
LFALCVVDELPFADDFPFQLRYMVQLTEPAKQMPSLLLVVANT